MENIFIITPANNQSLASRERKVCGVGINDANYMTSRKNSDGKYSRCPFYQVWKSMLERCYSEKYQRKQQSYLGCSVKKEWLTFMVFRDWMERQDWQGKQLDKDLKIVGNKIYGADSCVFITRKINNLIAYKTKKDTNYPTGVYLCKTTNRLKAQCCVNGKVKSLGYFSDAESASSAYIDLKKSLIERAASLPENKYIRSHLMNYANKLNCEGINHKGLNCPF